MKVKELIKQLQETGLNNDVRLESRKEPSELYLSFDDVGDVLIYEVED
jgi:hypothetical protein